MKSETTRWDERNNGIIKFITNTVYIIHEIMAYRNVILKANLKSILLHAFLGIVSRKNIALLPLVSANLSNKTGSKEEINSLNLLELTEYKNLHLLLHSECSRKLYRSHRSSLIHHF